ncbi:MAG: hypothetical protein HDR83_04535 [Bacteroides sp.]|nr:hypothetical protein [Barnesiella sp.]MBD5253366.1 hypothetical protein [Barnesiella sp.]MBD5368515.1 hypothetical protein [Bacteroides sp.]
MQIKKNSTRLIVNTGAQYARTLINLVLSLYSTRLILAALGLADYGIFTLIGGVVSMLAFMTNAMVTTTQRFMSYHQAKSDLETQQIIFGNSVLMHLAVSVAVLALLEIAGLFLFDGFLNIAPERLPAAKVVYQCTIAMILMSFITAPYKALIISHENIVYTSVVDVCDGVLKVGIAVMLTFMDADKLVTYGFLMLSIYVLNLLAYSIYDFRNYKECIMPRLRFFNREYVKSMSSFIGWQLYSTGCVLGRTQGTAIIINRFFGTVVNAAFGIALQLSGAVSFVSSALMLAINPQIVKAEGGGDRAKMFRLAEIASKFSYLLLAMIVIPIIFVLPEVLHLWLGEVPDYAVLFCSVILITGLVDMITTGLITSNQAIGNIGPYSLTINTIKLTTLPVLWLLLKFGVEIKIAIWCYAVIELICALSRLPFLKYSGGLNVGEFVKNVFLKIIAPTLFITLGCYALSTFQLILPLYLLALIPIVAIYCWIIYRFGLLANEQKIIADVVNSLRTKLHI